MENSNKKFKGPAVDRAIIMTQYDLRGFAHPLGLRMKYMKSEKSFHATVFNFFSFMYCPEPSDFDCWESSYEEYLLQCQEILASCDESRKEAIQLIIKEIIKQHKKFALQIQQGKRSQTAYLKPLSKENSQGRAILSLAEVFGVKVK